MKKKKTQIKKPSIVVILGMILLGSVLVGVVANVIKSNPKEEEPIVDVEPGGEETPEEPEVTEVYFSFVIDDNETSKEYEEDLKPFITNLTVPSGTTFSQYYTLSDYYFGECEGKVCFLGPGIIWEVYLDSSYTQVATSDMVINQSIYYLKIVTGGEETPEEPEDQVKLPTFRYGDKEYQFEEGMTWSQFVASEYNFDNFYFQYPENQTVLMCGDAYVLDGPPVDGYQLIIAGRVYTS